MVYKDEDGDGHGARFNAVTQVGCGNGLGWSSLRDDCDDMDRAIHPGSKEMCNYKDDNCNGRTDEGVRASCGVGWCRREAASCEPNATCIPNAPRDEMCNGFDDDCDDVIDNGAKCDGGKVCYKGTCVTSDEASMMAAAEPPPPPDAGVSSGAGGNPGTGTTSGGAGGTTGNSGSSGSSGSTTVGTSPSSGNDENSQPRTGCEYGGSNFGPGGMLGMGLAAAALLRQWRRRARGQRR
jgi:hypothetical protein